MWDKTKQSLTAHKKKSKRENHRIPNYHVRPLNGITLLQMQINCGKDIYRMRQDSENPYIVATGGKENDLKIWNLNTPDEPIFKAKNVSNGGISDNNRYQTYFRKWNQQGCIMLVHCRCAMIG